MYKVIKAFYDLQDRKGTKNGNVFHSYNVGDMFPRKGVEVSEARIDELSGKNNAQGEPLIEAVKKAAKAESKKTSKK